MLFNTLDFIFFLPLVVLFYYLIPQKYRWILLLLASYYFYMSWKVEYVLLIAFSTLVDYFTGLRMEKSKSKNRRRRWLILSLASNLGLLLFFKYFNFAATNFNDLLTFLEVKPKVPIMEFLLPVGISFYTFQTLSYSIDVYFGRQKAEKHLGYFALYVSFFPQLVAGPIERFSRLTPQFKIKHHFNYKNLKYGLRLILFGLFVKMVIADNLAPLVDHIYIAPEKYTSLDIFKGMVYYSFQIYGDFYGYSIIAIGSAQLLGIGLMDNFKTPYLAKNIAEFWQRWHISLSTWFRDYLYFPLGGNRVKKQRWILNILIVFVVSGLWHGANWTFLIWGALFGILYLVEHFTNKIFKLNFKKNRLINTLLVLKTFLLVTFIWVFFRSENLDSALQLFQALFKNGTHSDLTLQTPYFVLFFFLLFVGIDFLLRNQRFDFWLDNLPLIPRWGIYALFVFAIIVFAGVENFPFIYFQF